MSRTVVFTFERADTAILARAALKEVEKSKALVLDDALILIKDPHGHVHVRHDPQAAVIVGAIAGGVMGLMLSFMFPIISVIFGVVDTPSNSTLDQLTPFTREVNRTVMALPEWLETLPDGEIELVCSPSDRDLLPGLADRFAVKTAPQALAPAVGSIAHGRLAAGLGGDPALADANYVRRSDAELFWREF